LPERKAVDDLVDLRLHRLVLQRDVREHVADERSAAQEPAEETARLAREDVRVDAVHRPPELHQALGNPRAGSVEVAEERPDLRLQQVDLVPGALLGVRADRAQAAGELAVLGSVAKLRDQAARPLAQLVQLGLRDRRRELRAGSRGRRAARSGRKRRIRAHGVSWSP
jgi:hypothetical protein